MDELRAREPLEVFDDHLRLADQGDVEGDLARNYASDVVVLTGAGVHEDHGGARRLVALLEWTAATRPAPAWRTGRTRS